MNHTTWIDAQEVSVIREMVDRAQRDPVDNRRRAPPIAIVDYVGRLEKRGLTQAAHRTSRRISAQNGRPKAVLVQANERFTSRVPAEVFIRHEARRRCVGSGQPDFELYKSTRAIDGHDKRRRDDCVLPRCNAPEVDQWYCEVVGAKQRPVVCVGLSPSGERCLLRISETVRETTGQLVEFVLIRRRPADLGRRRHEAERSRARHLFGAEDAVEERAEANPTASKAEPRSKRYERNEIVKSSL